MRWAETQKHEIVHTGISITDALEAAKARLIAGDIIDAKIVEPSTARKMGLGKGRRKKGPWGPLRSFVASILK